MPTTQTKDAQNLCPQCLRNNTDLVNKGDINFDTEETDDTENLYLICYSCGYESSCPIST